MVLCEHCSVRPLPVVANNLFGGFYISTGGLTFPLSRPRSNPRALHPFPSFHSNVIDDRTQARGGCLLFANANIPIGFYYVSGALRLGSTWSTMFVLPAFGDTP